MNHFRKPQIIISLILIPFLSFVSISYAKSKTYNCSSAEMALLQQNIHSLTNIINSLVRANKISLPGSANVTDKRRHAAFNKWSRKWENKLTEYKRLAEKMLSTCSAGSTENTTTALPPASNPQPNLSYDKLQSFDFSNMSSGALSLEVLISTATKSMLNDARVFESRGSSTSKKIIDIKNTVNTENKILQRTAAPLNCKEQSVGKPRSKNDCL